MSDAITRRDLLKATPASLLPGKLQFVAGSFSLETQIDKLKSVGHFC